MCAEYHIKAKFKDIEKILGQTVTNISSRDEWDTRVKMTVAAPALKIHDGKLQLDEFVFPANPFPNARMSQLESNKVKAEMIETDDQIVPITRVPLWKSSFHKFPCIVPMTSFLEPVYWGDHQGEVVEFTDPHSEVFFVAGIFIKPRVPSTGKLNGFALLTHTASEQMLKYHHRMIVLLRPEDCLDYLKANLSSEQRYEFLIKKRYAPKFKVSVKRKMAKGWEKRVEKHAAALADEMKYVHRLET